MLKELTSATRLERGPPKDDQPGSVVHEIYRVNQYEQDAGDAANEYRPLHDDEISLNYKVKI